jgi:hypothetical protein
MFFSRHRQHFIPDTYNLFITGGYMGWKECPLMDEKLKFIARLLEGEKMAPLCREFGISRKDLFGIIIRCWG